MHCKCCCQTNIPGYPLIWIEQDKGLICSALSLWFSWRWDIFFLFWSVKLNRTIPVKQLNELTHCTMHMQSAAAKLISVFLLIALVKCPHVVYVFLQQRWDGGAHTWRVFVVVISRVCTPVPKGNEWLMTKCLSCGKTFRGLSVALISYSSLP